MTNFLGNNTFYAAFVERFVKEFQEIYGKFLLNYLEEDYRGS
jgi:hypothetical protein